MGVWIEIHCDYRFTSKDHLAAVCHDHANNLPCDMAGNRKQDIDHLLKMLKARAYQRGWRRFGMKWACPVCVKRLSEQPKEAKDNDA